MLLHIKNMVCDRCIMVVRQQFENSGFTVKDISLGLIDIDPEPTVAQLTEIGEDLNDLGFSLLDNKKDMLVDRIRTIIIEAIQQLDEKELYLNFPEAIASSLQKDYGYLSKLFSASEGTTIEKFVIQQKIEKVKELLQYGELNINEIAWKMGYSSSAHLSNQFKAITGFSPTEFKSQPANERKPLDRL